jgi:hypothetical protein
MSDTTILAPLDRVNLATQGLLGPGNSVGFRRIHKRRLNRSSDEEHREVSLDITVGSPAADNAFALIPVALVSRETLIYVGLSEAMATEMWDRWIRWPASGPRRETDASDGGLTVTFIDYITSNLKNQVRMVLDSDHDWQTSLDMYGIDVDTQNAIMDPHFKYLRLGESCFYWVKDTIEMRYAGLKDIQRASREREMELRRIASRPGRNEGRGGVGGHQGGPSQDAGLLSSTTGQRQRTISGVQQQTAPGIVAENWGSASAIAACNAPGYTVLFKGLDQGRIAGLFDETGTLSRIETLLSSPPSDFSGTRSLFYFTPDYQVAQYYAAYAKRRANCESVVIVCLSIANAAIERLSGTEVQRLYWPSPEWKELVWRSRTKQTLPSRLRKYRLATLLIGTISRKPDLVYQAMESWGEVTDSCLLRVGSSGQGKPSVQYVFSGEEEGRELLVNEGARNIKVFPYPESELEAWLAENRDSS